MVAAQTLVCTSITSVLYIDDSRSLRAAASATTPCDRPGGLGECFVKKRFMMSLVVGGLLAAMLPGVATARGGSSATATTFDVLALDYVWDGRLAGAPISDYVWDGRLAGSPNLESALTN